MRLELNGIHHVSALSAHIGRTRDFYTRVLGLRLVIKTVNQDEPSMYHLFFGDGAGSPGSDMTVFDMPRAAREHRGNNSITLTTFRVAGEGTLDWWAARFGELGVPNGGVTTRDGRRALDFEDPEGTRLSLVDDGGAGEAHPWAESTVPAEKQIRGLGYPVITVPELERTDRFLRQALGMREVRSYAVDGTWYTTHVYAGLEEGVRGQVHVVVRDDLPRARYGAGAVHHLALRVPEGQPIAGWVAKLDALGYDNSHVVDRHYFASVYVREPGGVLFELATDGPGFEVDGPIDADRLSLPPLLEPRRAEIESKLVPLDAAVSA